jgi:hypothetical protein
MKKPMPGTDETYYGIKRMPKYEPIPSREKKPVGSGQVRKPIPGRMRKVAEGRVLRKIDTGLTKQSPASGMGGGASSSSKKKYTMPMPRKVQKMDPKKAQMPMPRKVKRMDPESYQMPSQRY